MESAPVSVVSSDGTPLLLMEDDDQFQTFQQIWWIIFLWAFFSIFVIHLIATLIAFLTLRKHKYGRWTGVFVMAQGTISAVIVTTVTSAIVAFILLYSDFRLQHVHVMLCGLLQCVLYLFFASSTLMATL